ncbi:hypothetical protein [Sphingopyxis sp. JAI108]|uniref:hypothetical protein n=1 Tax=Sphingopyxis sp. JAI108 TaxID=2723060 RepID=UPI0015C9515C|nr:hypothetical protein [Sphingopyxis sp. JAI108]NYF30666.1 putative integral membrane protein [Sphingopyxis sp. JAI108]
MTDIGEQMADQTPTGDDAKTEIKTKANLRWPSALWLSARDADVDFYPRLNRERPIWRYRVKQSCQKLLLRFPESWRPHLWARGWAEPKQYKQSVVSLKSDALLRELPKAMEGWTTPFGAEGIDPLEETKAILEELVKPGKRTETEIAALRLKAEAALALPTTKAPTIDDAIDLAKMSFSEVKEQTEYQDQKATRLLTVTTFLSALSGALFAAFSTAYPLKMLAILSGGWRFALLFAYLSFLVFVIAAIGGALITFHATRTRFKYSKEATAARQKGHTRSFLFYREIIAVSPQGWADSFIKKADGKTILHADLKEKYFKNQVIETYLIAAKAADKLRYLGPAQSLLAWALRSLLLFVILIAAIQAFLPRQVQPASDVRLIAPAAPVPITIGTPIDIRLPARPPHPAEKKVAGAK